MNKGILFIVGIIVFSAFASAALYQNNCWKLSNGTTCINGTTGFNLLWGVNLTCKNVYTSTGADVCSGGTPAMDYTHIQNYSNSPCPAGQYAYDRWQNGTFICRDDQMGAGSDIDNKTIVRSYNTTWKADTLTQLQSTVTNDFHNLGGVDKVNTTTEFWDIITNGTFSTKQYVIDANTSMKTYCDYSEKVNTTTEIWALIINGTMATKQFVIDANTSMKSYGDISFPSYSIINTYFTNNITYFNSIYQLKTDAGTNFSNEVTWRNNNITAANTSMKAYSDTTFPSFSTINTYFVNNNTYSYSIFQLKNDTWLNLSTTLKNDTNANLKTLNVSQTLYVNSSCTITGNATPCIIQTCGSSQIILCS